MKIKTCLTLLLGTLLFSESVMAADETTPNDFSVGAGIGITEFGGNMGKLYSTSPALIDVRFGYILCSIFNIRIGADRATYEFDAAPNGLVDSRITKMNLDLEYHFLAIKQAGLDPYVVVGVDSVERQQTFQTLNSVQKDTAFGFGSGLGVNYFFIAKRLSVWLEAEATQINFKDRNSSTYAQAGIPNTKGLQFSGSAGMQFHF